ncbi:MAG: hypothetical protein A3K41_08575 [Chloroflexi bacterium RIFOXYD12_FULL_57_15]|nr:MAG: hypothetical protein A3K41_08575 [Chloroflexi bacterium RIFOXYD12_FULL_57_15]
MHFVEALWAGGGGDDEMERQAALFHALEHGVLAHAGGSGDDDQQGAGMWQVEMIFGWHWAYCT